MFYCQRYHPITLISNTQKLHGPHFFLWKLPTGFMVSWSRFGVVFFLNCDGKRSCHVMPNPKKNKPKPDRHWIVPGARNRSLRSSFSAPNLVFSNGNLPTASNSHGRFPFRFPSRNEQKAPFLKKQL